MISEDQGLSALYISMQENKKNAREIFQLVTEERLSNADLQRLISPEVLMKLIFLCVDITKSSRGVVNQLKSKQVAKASKAKAESILNGWLDKNIHKYKGYLDNCAHDALNALPNLGKSWSWVRREITAYIKLKSLKGDSPTASS